MDILSIETIKIKKEVNYEYDEILSMKLLSKSILKNTRKLKFIIILFLSKQNLCMEG